MTACILIEVLSSVLEGKLSNCGFLLRLRLLLTADLWYRLDMLSKVLLTAKYILSSIIIARENYHLGSNFPAQLSPTALKILTSPLTISSISYPPVLTFLTPPTFCSTTFRTPFGSTPVITAV